MLSCHTESEIAGVGDTGLNAEEEHANRERKYSVGGVDVRRFGNSADSGFKPTNDPYYGRKPVDSKSHSILPRTPNRPPNLYLQPSICSCVLTSFAPESQTVGVGELDNTTTPAEAYATRERKQSAVNFSSDPFEQLVGSRESHRQSISSPSAVGVAAAATERRRSSAVGPHAMQHAAQANALHSGYGGGDTLAPIESRPEIPPSRGVDGTGSMGADDISSAAPSSNGPAAANGDHTVFHDVTTHDAVTSGHETHHALGKGVQKQDYDFVDKDSVDPMSTN